MPSQFVYPINRISEFLMDTSQAKYCIEYLCDLKAKTFVREEKYIDKDYLIDFSNFYARSFDVDEKYTERYHFFSIDFDDDDLLNLVENNDEKQYNILFDSYLGFIVLKPIKLINGNKILGRTLLKTYPEKVPPENIEKRYYLSQNYEVSLFGLKFEIKSLPFQVQDSVVGGCATTACWTALHGISSLFGTEKFAPYEITLLSVDFPNIGRNFPSTGLTLFQMKTQFNALGLETEIINPQEIAEFNFAKPNDDIVADAIKGFNNLGIPVIAIVEFDKNDWHAVVVSGYRHRYGVIKEIYIHDDQIGPFHHVQPRSLRFDDWINDWTTKKGRTEAQVVKLLIPIYPKLRLNFGFIYEEYLFNKRQLEATRNRLGLSKDIILELLLIDVNKYKSELIGLNFNNKIEVLTSLFPRYIWVIRTSIENTPINDKVYDATAVHVHLLHELDFEI